MRACVMIEKASPNGDTWTWSGASCGVRSPSVPVLGFRVQTNPVNTWPLCACGRIRPESSHRGHWYEQSSIPGSVDGVFERESLHEATTSSPSSLNRLEDAGSCNLALVWTN